MKRHDGYDRHHATIFVPGHASDRVERLRRTWDPAMAYRVKAHVTLVYPREAPDPDLLSTRLSKAATHTEPFRLVLEGTDKWGEPPEGVYVRVQQPGCGWSALRELILAAPFSQEDVEPHVTIAHPETAKQPGEAWQDVRGQRIDTDFSVDVIHVTAFDGKRWIIVESHPLAGEMGDERSDVTRNSRRGRNCPP